MSPNLRAVATMLEMVDEKGKILRHQPTWQARASACGWDIGELPKVAASGMPGYADFYLCAPNADSRIRQGLSTLIRWYGGVGAGHAL